MFTRKPIGGAYRLGQAKSTCAAEHKIDGGLQADAMADRHEQRAHCAPCAQHRADRRAVIEQRRPCAALDAWLLVDADKTRLGHAYRRHIGEHSHVACETKAARMRQPLTVDQQ